MLMLMKQVQSSILKWNLEVFRSLFDAPYSFFINKTSGLIASRFNQVDASLQGFQSAVVASFSGLLDDALEAAGLIEDAYVLEISSPGIAETLNEDRDFRSFRGFPVCVRYRDAKTGAEAEREGLLLERTDDSVQINVRGRTVRLPRADVIAVRLTTPTEG